MIVLILVAVIVIQCFSPWVSFGQETCYKCCFVIFDSKVDELGVGQNTHYDDHWDALPKRLAYQNNQQQKR
jgi:hypothetical protein